MRWRARAPGIPCSSPTRSSCSVSTPGELDTGQWQALLENRLGATPASAVRADPRAAADAAITRLEQHVEAIVVHFDVDVIDSGLFPLSNFPHYAGISLDDAATALARLCASPKVVALTVTEVNPNHDPDRSMMRRLAEVIAAAL